MSDVAAVGPHEFEPGKTVADFVEHERCAIPVLHASRMDDYAQRQALRIDESVNFAALQLLASVIAGQAIMIAPFMDGPPLLRDGWYSAS